MKDKFDIKRFGKYIASDLKGCIAKYGLSALILSLSGVLIYIITIIINLMVGKGWDAPGEAGRWTCLTIACAAMIISLPIKCYGHITDKGSGSAFALLPVSTFEKFLSMIINCLVIFPAAFLIVYIGTDWLICALDQTAGISIINSIGVNFSLNEDIPQELSITANLHTAIDDFYITILVFLLGGLCFKSSKAAKTILVMMAIGIVASILSAPLIIYQLFGSIDQMSSIDSDLFLNNINVLAKFDTVLDLLVLCGLLAGIFFRLKTIKH